MRGISIIGAVFALLILAIFGTAIVVLVGTDQEVRRRHIEKENAFYEVQAGIEYAIREINYGGYPVVTNKQLGTGSFTTVIDYSQHLITCAGTTGDISKTHMINYTPMGGDCADIGTAGLALQPPGYNILTGANITKTCLNAISIDKMLFTWNPDSGEKVTKIVIDGVAIYDDAVGAPSGTVIDVQDYKISDGSTHNFNEIRFSTDMQNKDRTMTIYFTDTSYKSVTLGIAIGPGMGMFPN